MSGGISVSCRQLNTQITKSTCYILKNAYMHKSPYSLLCTQRNAFDL